MTEDKMVGWHHRVNGHDFEATPEDVKGQGSLACCSPWGCKESDTTENLNNNNLHKYRAIYLHFVKEETAAQKDVKTHKPMNGRAGIHN